MSSKFFIRYSIDIYLILVIIFLACVVIGLPTYLCGYERVIQPFTFRYFTADVQIIDYKIIKTTCEKCNMLYLNKRYQCFPLIYDCYKFYNIGQYLHENKKYTCDIDVRKSADNYIEPNYIMNRTYDMFIRKDLSVDACMTNSNVRDLAIAGFTFLLLASVVLVVGILYAIWYKYALYHNEELREYVQEEYILCCC